MGGWRAWRTDAEGNMSECDRPPTDLEILRTALERVCLHVRDEKISRLQIYLIAYMALSRISYPSNHEGEQA
jgi:hypothetical protein